MLIFDFDGTIADSLSALISCFNNNATYYGYKTVTNIESLRNKEAREIMRELELPSLQLPFVVRTVRNEMRSLIHTLKPFPEIVETITELYKKGVCLGIISSNSKENVQLFLQNNNMDFFKYIHGESSIFGKNKVIKSFLRSNSIKASDVIYIGDETRDIEAAKYNNIKSAAVTWGFNNSQKLQAQNPHYIINSPKDLFNLVS